MQMTRRDLLRALLAAPIAATVDVEQLLWTPRPIVVVPALQRKLTAQTVARVVHVPVELIEITSFGDAHRSFIAGGLRPVPESVRLIGAWLE